MKRRLIDENEIHRSVNQLIINGIWEAFYKGFITYEQLEFELKTQSNSYQNLYGQIKFTEEETIELLELEE